jgi:hypothetical protein
MFETFSKTETQQHVRRRATPDGCHVAEMEVDQDTGAVAIVRYHAGGGRALRNNIVYDDPVGGLYAHHEIRCLLDHSLSRMMTADMMARDESHPDECDPADCLCAHR